MKYFIITILALSITTFLVYKLANNLLGYRLHVKPILLCAGIALMISLIIPRIFVNFVGLTGTFIVLTLFTLISAFMIAYYEDQMICKKCKTTDNVSLNAEEINTDEINLDKEHSELIDAIIVESPIMEHNYDEDILLSQGETMSMQEFLPTHEEEIFIQVPDSESFDDLIDFAYEQKEQNNLNVAAEAFEKILRLYPNNDGIVYIIIELGNIYKNKGLYKQAINVFTLGRDLPNLEINEIMKQEFINTIAFLKIIENTLLDNRLGFLPYSLIPVHILEQIDKEYQEWLNQV